MRENILPFFVSHDVRTVLDYGCGKHLRDSLYLSANGLTVDAVDLERQLQRIDHQKARKIHSLSPEIIGKNYDAALLNFVLQTLPTEEQREKVLKRVCSAIKDDGYLVLSLRNQRDMRHCVEKNGRPSYDGFLMQTGRYYTFVRGYEKAEIEELLDSADLTVVEITRTCDSFIALSQKREFK